MSQDSNRNRVLESMRHLDAKYQKINEQQSDFIRRQTNGEKPDPDEFTKLLELQSVTGTAMTAQFGLYQKPLKTVLSDSR